MEFEKAPEEGIGREELEKRAGELGFRIPEAGEPNPTVPSNLGVAHTTFESPRTSSNQ